MAGQPFTTGPAYITNAAADIASVVPVANTYRLIRQIRLVNTDSSARTVTLYKGASGGSTGGTEVLKAHSIPANDEHVIYYPSGDRYSATQFLSGLASVTNVVTIEVIGEAYVA